MATHSFLARLAAVLLVAAQAPPIVAAALCDSSTPVTVTGCEDMAPLPAAAVLEDGAATGDAGCARMGSCSVQAPVLMTSPFEYIARFQETHGLPQRLCDQPASIDHSPSSPPPQA